MTRMHYSIAAFSFLLSSGCRYSEQKALATGGARLETGGDDTAMGQSNGMNDTGMSGIPPVVESVEAEWREDTNNEWYILSSLTYTDGDDDVRVGGSVGVTMVVDGDSFTEEWFAIDGEYAVHDDESGSEDGGTEDGSTGASGTVQFNPRPTGVDDPMGVSVELTIRLKDAQNNRSNEITVIPE